MDYIIPVHLEMSAKLEVINKHKIQIQVSSASLSLYDDQVSMKFSELTSQEDRDVEIKVFLSKVVTLFEQYSVYQMLPILTFSSDKAAKWFWLWILNSQMYYEVLRVVKHFCIIDCNIDTPNIVYKARLAHEQIVSRAHTSNRSDM